MLFDLTSHIKIDYAVPNNHNYANDHPGIIHVSMDTTRVPAPYFVWWHRQLGFRASIWYGMKHMQHPPRLLRRLRVLRRQV